MGNTRTSEGGERPAKSRAIVMRCPDASYDEILRYLRDRGDCYIVYTKSSNMKLVVEERGF